MYTLKICLIRIGYIDVILEYVFNIIKYVNISL